MESTLKSGSSVDQAGNALHGAINRTAEAARPAVDRLAAGAHNAVDKVANAAGFAAETFDAKSAQLKNASDKALGNARGYVQEHPLATIGIAVAAGYLLSSLLRSR